MQIVIAGASGFLGTALVRHLQGSGHGVLRLVRGEPTGPDEERWDPANGRLDPNALAKADTVINLGGASIGHWPWTSAYKQKIIDSRQETTGTIASTIAALDNPPALVNSSGINYYGMDRGDEQVDEDSPSGTGFLAEVCRQWEAATQPATDAGARVVLARTSPVLDSSGGALKLIKIPFLLGVAGRLGDGQQFFPSISLTDYVEAMTRLATGSSISGPYNLVAPVVPTNAEFTKALGAKLRRPTVVPVPAFALKAVVGELSQAMLGSLHATPKRLIESGFIFQHPTIEAELDAAFSKRG